jgi:phenylacetate-CoA ligase
VIFNHEAETMSREQMNSLQLQRLKETVKRVFDRVPFYRTRFLEKGLTPDDITSLDCLRELPFTVKKDLRDNYPFGLFAVEQSAIVRLHASSGTKGKPTVVGYTKKDVKNWAEMVARAIAAAGGEPGGVLHNAYGYGLFTGGLGLHYGSERLGMATVPISGGNTERQILLIEDFKPAVICGTPSYILNIVETMERLGKDPKSTSLQYGIFGAEPWSEEMRHELEARLGIKAVDIYGLSEVMGPGVSIECHEAQNGLHIMEDHFIVEVIDPNTREPLSDGTDGELVITSLTKEALPMIRYRTGDIASLHREQCPCGRTTIRMSRVKGRIDDMLIVRGVNIFPSEIENALLQVEELSPYYQLVLTRNGPLDNVTLTVEVTQDVYMALEREGMHEATGRLEKKIEAIIKSLCLVTIKSQIVSPGTLPRSEGKAIRVVDRRFETTSFT